MVLLVIGLVSCSSGSDKSAGKSGEKSGKTETTLGKVTDTTIAAAAPVKDTEGALEDGLGEVGITADPDSLSCSETDDLSKGDEVTCDFTTDGQPVGLVAKVDGVDGEKVKVDVSTEAKAVPADVLAEDVAARVGQFLGGANVSATCADELAPKVGATATCTLTLDNDKRDFKVEVAKIDGGQIDYNISQAS